MLAVMELCIIFKEIKPGSITLADTINKSIEDVIITASSAVNIN
jgi:hypothetical protein